MIDVADLQCASAIWLNYHILSIILAINLYVQHYIDIEMYMIQKVLLLDGYGICGMFDNQSMFA